MVICREMTEIHQLYCMQLNVEFFLKKENLNKKQIIQRNVSSEHYLSFSDQLLPIAIGGVSRDLTGPEGHPHHQISTTHHQKRQEVDEDGHTHVVPALDTHIHIQDKSQDM